MRAADAGKHVLCEKPMAVETATTRPRSSSRRPAHDVFLLEAFAYRSHPQTHRLVELLRTGASARCAWSTASFGYDAGPRADELPDEP